MTPEMAATGVVTNSADVTPESANDSKRFLIVIPAIVVVLLIVLAISITVKSCNKKRQRTTIVIKERIETEGEQEIQDH